MIKTDTPAELESAMRAALGGKADPTAADSLEAAERLLDKVLRTDCESRSGALDLLTVDALVTSAMEAVAADLTLLKSFPEQAMQRIAKRGTE